MVNIDIILWNEWVRHLPDEAPEKALVEILVEKYQDDKEQIIDHNSRNDLNEFIYPH